ncbi:hypothetical protein [Bacillus paralicheniformis]|uniref:hypothetical protein n=1 Tax=Bacillus paralicheniformis TaxID=1648923 RepID=UPI001CC4E549|nr:hypothetical protein [Bacillus paralicheniformis]UAY71961.1 hypothetical protein K8336_07950 [Bacillus paralicheniformis]
MMALTIPVAAYMLQFTDRAEELANTKLEDAPTVAKRNQKVNDMIEEHYTLTGKMPKSDALRFLADYILITDLKNKDVDKVSNEEFPILSDIQVKRRHRKQMLMKDETLDFLNNKVNKQLDSLSRTTVKKAEY